MDFEPPDGAISWPVVLWVVMCVCAILPAWIKNERAAKVLIGISKFCLALWFIRGFADYFLGISFAGRTLDFICEFSLPFIFVPGWRLTRRFSLLQPKWLHNGASFAVFYWLIFPILVIFLMGVRPHINNRLQTKDVYDGKYFRYETAGQQITMAAGLNGPVTFGYRKYLFLERRLSYSAFYQIDTIFNVRENMYEMKFDIKYYGIHDTLRDRSISGW